MDPSFIGYLVYENNCLIGTCLGARRYWWQGDEYYINENLENTDDNPWLSIWTCHSLYFGLIILRVTACDFAGNLGNATKLMMKFL